MNYAVIMGGGKGTRFWPVSTNKRPKQFLTLSGSRSMLRQTVDRLRPFVRSNNIYIIGNQRHYTITSRELKNIPKKNIIAEPVGRNTAPCLGLASILIKKKDRNAVIIATPADHIITQEKRFLQLLKSATCHARDTNMFVTFGIPPSSPDTGYGYIEIRNKKQRGGAYRVKRFVEKPSLRKAKQYVLSKHFFWNSGIFVFHVQTLLEAIESHMPHLYDGLMKIEKAMGTSQEKAVIHKVYHSIKSVSIDYGIMEKINNVLLMKAHIGWNDVGNWSSLDAIKEKDSKGNIVHGSCVMLNSENNIINAHDKLIALIGIKDSIVVQTDTVVLVANKKDAQDVKRIVEKLERQNKNDYL